MISNSLAYAFKAIIYIAVKGSKSSKVRIKDLKEAIDIPEAYVAKLLQELVRNNILRSSKGPHGGFYLSESDMKTPLMEIVNIIEGSDSYTRCLLTLENCDKDHPCPLHRDVGRLRQELVNKFSKLTLEHLALDVEAGRSFIS